MKSVTFVPWPSPALAFSTHHNAKREHVGGFVNATFSISFRTAPVLIAHLSTPNVAAGRNVGGIFEITETNLINCYSVAALAPLNKDVVRFDVYDALAIIIKKAGRSPDRYAQCSLGAAQQDHPMYLSKCAL